jgi:hypothetical protein
MALIVRPPEYFEALIRQYADQVETAERLAAADVEAGRFRFIFNEAVHYDFVDWFGEYLQLLKERLGVDGYVPYKIEAPNYEAAWVFEVIYYRCMSAAIEGRSGGGILDRLNNEAKESYQRKRVTPG